GEPMSRPIGDEDEAPERFVDQAGSRAGELLRELPEPAAWSPGRKQRVRGAIGERLGRRVGAGGGGGGGGERGGAGGGGGVGGGVGNRGNGNVNANLNANAIVVATGRAELHGDRVVLTDGQVVVSARSAPVWVEAPAQHARVRVASSGVAEVRLVDWRVQV